MEGVREKKIFAVKKGTDYYPFGLTMNGISSKALNFGQPENKKKFVEQEFDEDLGLNWYQFKWRNHDPQIGRFIEIDPLAEEYEYNSTYAYAENRVIDGIDLEGLEFWRTVGNALKSAGDWINRNINPVTPVVELVTGRDYNNGNFDVPKPRLQSAAELGTVIVGGKLVASGANAVKNVIVQEIVKGVENKTAGVIVNQAEKQITKNAAQGAAYEKVVTKELVQEGRTNVASQVTVKPNGASGKVRLDNISRGGNGEMVLTDAKSSATAGFTPNQKVGYPLLEKNGGVVVGNKGTPQGYPAGTIIPPTKVEVKRPF